VILGKEVLLPISTKDSPHISELVEGMLAFSSFPLHFLLFMMTPRGHSSHHRPTGQFLVYDLALPTKTAITNLLNLSDSRFCVHI
jgi:hypothetical protein